MACRPARSIPSTSEDAVIIKNDAGIVTLTRESFAVNPEGMLMALLFVPSSSPRTPSKCLKVAEILTAAQARAKEAAGDDGAASGASQ